MFTGLVSLAHVKSISTISHDMRLSIKPKVALEKLEIGESIAVNGVCLTVESFDSGSFSAFASSETLKVSNLGDLKTGSLVNIERALAMGDRLGGHMVSGHIDGVAKVEEISEIGKSIKIKISLPESFSSQVIPKGSICLDGISLTVNQCGSGFLEVNIIPETQQATSIKLWKKGQKINFETDMIGKYVQAFLSTKDKDSAPKKNSGISIESLIANGF